MKLASFCIENRATFGVFVDDGLLDLGVRLPNVQGGLRGLLESPEFRRLPALLKNASPDVAIDGVRFLPVIPNPDKVLCVGINYVPHVKETGRDLPEKPVIFCRFSGSQTGHEQPLVRPRVSSKFDYEGELAVVIGRRARHVAPKDALQVVAGYTCFNDGSVRDWQRHSPQFTPGKNFAQSGSMGPWLVTSEEVPDPSALRLETRVNGEIRQSARLTDLIFSIPELIAYCSTFAELLPGDVIATGTPGGVGFARTPPVWLNPGDIVEVDIPGVGTLRNTVVDEQPVET
jgi:2-keto-4-pentenoate hydratase/2-oxohepta-3-ene-1,7-dioic acid hydratase in catechol pathway